MNLHLVTETCPQWSLPHGGVSYSSNFPSNEQDRVGIVANFSCNSQYIRIGASSARCNNEGHWTYTGGAPVCIGELKISWNYNYNSFLLVFVLIFVHYPQALSIVYLLSFHVLLAGSFITVQMRCKNTRIFIFFICTVSSFITVAIREASIQEYTS